MPDRDARSAALVAESERIQAQVLAMADRLDGFAVALRLEVARRHEERRTDGRG